MCFEFRSNFFNFCFWKKPFAFWHLPTFKFLSFQESVNIFHTELHRFQIRINCIPFVGFKIFLMKIQVFRYKTLQILLTIFLIFENINQIIWRLLLGCCMILSRFISNLYNDDLLRLMSSLCFCLTVASPYWF